MLSGNLVGQSVMDCCSHVAVILALISNPILLDRTRGRKMERTRKRKKNGNGRAREMTKARKKERRKETKKEGRKERKKERNTIVGPKISIRCIQFFFSFFTCVNEVPK